MLEQDTIQTSAGDLKITFIGHASLIFEFGGKVIDEDGKKIPPEKHPSGGG